MMGMVVNTQIAYFLNSYWSGRFIDYAMLEQVRDIMPSFILAISTSAIVLIIGWLLPFGYLPTLIIQVISGAVLVFIIAEVTKLEAYLFMKNSLQTKFSEIKNGSGE